MARVDGRSHRVKAEAVGLSVVKGAAAASRETGIPRKTITYWREQPEFAELRQQKRDEVAADIYAVFQKGIRRIEELLPLTDDMGKVAVATGILYDKLALMSGDATVRTETRDATAMLPDGEKEALADAIDSWLKERA
jgi:hypothetical protein